VVAPSNQIIAKPSGVSWEIAGDQLEQRHTLGKIILTP